MKQLYWNICGEGDRDLVLLHGWGLNAEVWHCIIDRLSPHFRLHLVDLPVMGAAKILVRCHCLIWPPSFCSKRLNKRCGWVGRWAGWLLAR